MPCPDKATAVGLLAASLPMLSVADPGPADFGANSTWIEQLPPGTTPVPDTQLLSNVKKSGSPLIEREFT
jgi:hypothetical protein